MATDAELTRSRPWYVTLSVWVSSLFLLGLLIYVFAKPTPLKRDYPDRIPVRFWHMWTAEWKVVIDRIVDAYNQSQDSYEVIALSVPTNSASGGGTQNASQKVLLAIAGGDPPDCMGQWNPVLPSWAEKGLIRPLDEIMTPEEEADIRRRAYPIAIKLGSYQDRIYGILTGINAFACYYRPTHLAEAGLGGIPFPTTLEDFWETSKKLTRYDTEGRMTRLGFSAQNPLQYVPIMGGGLFNEETGSLNFAAPALLKACEWVYQTTQYYGFEELTRFNSGLNSAGGATGWPFISGQYSIAFDGQWRIEQMARYAPDLKYKTAPMPSPGGDRQLAGWSNGNFVVIPTGAKHPEGAWDFIKFWSGVTDPERAAEFMTWGGWLPMTRDTAEAPAYREYVKRYPQFQTFLDLLPSENLEPTPPVTYQVFVGDTFGRLNEALVRGSKTPAEAVEFFRAEIEGELARRERLRQ